MPAEPTQLSSESQSQFRLSTLFWLTTTGAMVLKNMRLDFIDSWRAIAVSMVIFAHLFQNINIAEFLQNSGFEFIKGYGQTGVFIFFFISGYVVRRTLLAEFKHTPSIDVGGFYIRRVFRILPPMMIT